MQSLLSRTRNFLTPSGSTTDLSKFRTEKRAESLFQQPDPAVDGEDCLHDCASCTEQLPRKWAIDESDTLYGHVKGWETHLIVGTGKSNWLRDVTDEKGSLMQAVGERGLELSNGKLMLSASNMPASSDCGDAHDASGSADGVQHSEYVNQGKTRVIVLPKWQMVDGVGINEAKWLLEDVIAKGSTNSSPLSKEPVKKAEDLVQEQPVNGEHAVQKEHEPELEDIPSIPTTNRHSQFSSAVPAGVTIKPLQHRAIILMCSHGTRDWRCGKSAPILKREFERHLRPLGLFRDFDDVRPNGVGIYFINHVGGHKYSANVIIYRRQGRMPDRRTLGGGSEDEKEDLKDEAVQGIWLARVRPEDCENIVKYTVLQGKVLKPQRQLRGGFDREKGVLSW